MLKKLQKIILKKQKKTEDQLKSFGGILYHEFDKSRNSLLKDPITNEPDDDFLTCQETNLNDDDLEKEELNLVNENINDAEFDQLDEAQTLQKSKKLIFRLQKSLITFFPKRWYLLKENFLDYKPEQLLQLFRKWLENIFQDKQIKYITLGREECPNTKQIHFHCYLEFSQGNIYSRTFFKHFEDTFGIHPNVKQVTQGTEYQTVEYCQKDKDFHESGLKPKLVEVKKKYTQLNLLNYLDESAQQQVPFNDLLKNRNYRPFLIKDISRQALNYQQIQNIYYPPQNLQQGLKTCFWIHGPPGVGKTHFIIEKIIKERNIPYIIKETDSIWWQPDAVKAEIVILDDLDENFGKKIGFETLKRWLDRYTFSIQIKGSLAQIRPYLIIITSNYTPTQLFGHIQNIMLKQAIERRIEDIFDFVPGLGNQYLSEQDSQYYAGRINAQFDKLKNYSQQNKQSILDEEF